jgi:potassium-transporting ATPase KdpC subunit
MLMSTSIRSGVRHYWVAVRALLVLTVLLGVVYPLVVTGIGQLAFPAHANGSLVHLHGTPVGSALLGQSFAGADGSPLPQWFQSRPTAGGAKASGASNLGPENPQLVEQIGQRKRQITAVDGVASAAIPPDAVTASGSGLDPHISVAYALLQADRVAAARHITPTRIRALVASTITEREIGYLGEPVVNVMLLNLALARMDG